MRLEIPKICRYCGGVVRLVPAAEVYGMAAAKRLGIEQERFYQCQNCNARVGCHILMQVHQKFLFVRCIRRIRNVQTYFLKKIVILKK